MEESRIVMRAILRKSCSSSDFSWKACRSWMAGTWPLSTSCCSFRRTNTSSLSSCDPEVSILDSAWDERPDSVCSGWVEMRDGQVNGCEGDKSATAPHPGLPGSGRSATRNPIFLLPYYLLTGMIVSPPAKRGRCLTKTILKQKEIWSFA